MAAPQQPSGHHAQLSPTESLPSDGNWSEIEHWLGPPAPEVAAEAVSDTGTSSESELLEHKAGLTDAQAEPPEDDRSQPSEPVPCSDPCMAAEAVDSASESELQDIELQAGLVDAQQAQAEPPAQDDRCQHSEPDGVARPLTSGVAATAVSNTDQVVRPLGDIVPTVMPVVVLRDNRNT